MARSLLNSAMCSSNFAFEELVLRSLRASRLMNPFLTPGAGGKISVGLSVLYPRIIISVFEISYCSIIARIASLFMFHRDMMSSMYLFQIYGVACKDFA